MATYQKEQTNKLNLKLKALMSELPDFCEDYFRGKNDTTQIRTRVAYAFDLRTFFLYLKNNAEQFADRSSAKDFVMDDLDRISAIDIEKFAEYLSMYSQPDHQNPDKIVTYTNTTGGKMRKLSTLRSFYKYYYKKKLIKTNPSVLVELPKLHNKPIVRLDPNESANLLDVVEASDFAQSDRQRAYSRKNALRDLAIVSLLLGTGIRVSECVGLNVADFNFVENSFAVTRKGGDRAILYLPNEVSEILQKYLREVRSKITDPNDADAFFLSQQKNRLCVSSIEKLVKKYAQCAVPLKKISPHKLRSTFGTNLYRESGDIYLVAEVLGHNDVNTTKKHYAALDEDRLRQAAKLTKLRD